MFFWIFNLPLIYLSSLISLSLVKLNQSLFLQNTYYFLLFNLPHEDFLPPVTQFPPSETISTFQVQPQMTHLPSILPHNSMNKLRLGSAACKHKITMA